MKKLLLILLIVSIGLLTGCSLKYPDTQWTPGHVFTTDNTTSSTLNAIPTNMTYYYSVDCKHNTICYFYYGSASAVSCVYVPIGILNEAGECK